MARIRVTSARQKPAQPLETAFFRSSENIFAGYVFDPINLVRIYTVDLLIDGIVIKTASANEYVHELATRKVGSACYGFVFPLNADAIENAHVVEARVSNLGHLIGAPILLTALTEEPGPAEGPGAARWLGGLRFSGWVRTDSPTAPILNVIVDGSVVSRTKALGWTHVGSGGDRGRAARSFDFHLAERFADGGVHHLALTTEDGESVSVTPLPFMAFADGLAATIARLGAPASERLRSEFFDRLLPMSIPLSHYEEWSERFPVATPVPVPLKCAVILVGPGNVGITLPSLEEQTHDDWVAASLVAQEQQAVFEPGEARAFLDSDGTNCDFVIFAFSGTRFASNALARIAAAFNEFNDSTIVYGDVDIVTRDGGRWPLALPAFDYERLLEQGYCAHFFAMRYDVACQSLASGASDLYRLFNSVFDREMPSPENIIHLPRALAIIPALIVSEASKTLCGATSDHLSARGTTARVVPGAGAIWPAATVSRAAPMGHTTVIIPTRNRLALLRQCLETIRPAVDRVAAQILILDNDSTDPETLDYLDRISSDSVTRVLRIEGPFNFSRLNNLAAGAIDSDYLCLLNNDVEAIDDLWLEEMLGRIAEPDVGAVGALLVWPSNVIQHGGVVLGSSFAAHHAFNDRVYGDPGPADLLRVAHQCGAVTAACLLTKRQDYLQVGGLDEVNFSVAFNDVDYCLKLRSLGKRIVFTPHARLLHLESASRGHDDKADQRSRFQRELQMMRSRWTDAVLDDPYYSPIMSLDPVPYSALAWPPRSSHGRWPKPPVPKDIPPGL